MNDTPTIGDNNPPTGAEIIKQRLDEDYQALSARQAELLEAMERTPETIGDTKTCNKVIEFTKQIKLAARDAEKYRKDEKEVFLASGRTVDGWFKSKADPLIAAAKTMEGKITVWQRKVAEEERKRRAEEERKAREEQERLEREAKEAEEAVQDDASLDVAIEAEDAAETAQADTQSAEKASNAATTDMTRTHTESGVSASMSTFWNFRSLNMATIDLNALRPHFNQDTIEKAVKAAIRAGARDINGVEIFEDTKSTVR